MAKKRIKQYEIDSFEKIINIANRENFEMLTTDFLLWLDYTIRCIDHLRKKEPELYKGQTNWQVMESIFIWVDDGKNELTQFKVKDKSTGEIHTIKVSKK